MRPEILSHPEFVVFETRDYAVQAKVSLASASRQLGRAADRGALTRVTRGLWANTRHPHFHPLVCVPRILAKEQGYVSFLTALHLHGVLSQIPATTQVATTGHGRRLATPVGVYELFHLAPEFMRQGIEWSTTRIPYRIATAERALLDALYLSTRKRRRFAALPELDLSPPGFRRREFLRLVGEVGHAPLETAVRARFSRLVEANT